MSRLLCSVRLPLAVIVVAGLLAACGGSSQSSSGSSGAAGSGAASAGRKLDAPAVATPPKPAPDFTLRDSLGHRVTLSQYRGKAVLLTFIYDHCPDICPLMVSNLRNARALLGPAASKAQVIAVSVDPKGDTPTTVRSFLAAHRMTGGMEYLVGSQAELAPVWRAYGVGVHASPDTREVDHTAAIYGITGGGQITALYPSDFKPAWIAHDVPILAAR